MSLDVYLIIEKATPELDSLRGRIFIREKGQNKEITREEWDERFPGREPVVLLGDDLTNGVVPVYSANITHNLGRMAREVGLYEWLWRPDELAVTRAGELVAPLRAGLERLLAEEDRLQEFNPENGWGDYDGLVHFTAGYLAACESWPDARVEVSR